MPPWINTFNNDNELIVNNSSAEQIHIKQEIVKRAKLDIKGANSKVIIKQGKFFYDGGVTLSANSEMVIHINNKQLLDVYVYGANTNLFIEGTIRENILINNFGANLEVSEL